MTSADSHRACGCAGRVPRVFATSPLGLFASRPSAPETKSKATCQREKKRNSGFVQPGEIASQLAPVEHTRGPQRGWEGGQKCRFRQQIFVIVGVSSSRFFLLRISLYFIFTPYFENVQCCMKRNFNHDSSVSLSSEEIVCVYF